MYMNASHSFRHDALFVRSDYVVSYVSLLCFLTWLKSMKDYQLQFHIRSKVSLDAVLVKSISIVRVHTLLLGLRPPPLDAVVTPIYDVQVSVHIPSRSTAVAYVSVAARSGCILAKPNPYSSILHRARRESSTKELRPSSANA